MTETLLGESMPIKCSVSKNTAADLLEKLYITDQNLSDIEKAKQTWSKYWPKLASDKSLLELDEKLLKVVKKRRMIAGPSTSHPIQAYQITAEEFTKPIDPSEVESIKKHHSSGKPYIIPLVSVDGKSVTMKNVLTGLDPKVICNIVLHQTIFDPTTIEEHEDNIMLGNPIYELSYFVKELIDVSTKEYLRLSESRPTFRSHGNLLAKLLRPAEATAKLVQAIKEISSFDQLQANTGYNLLIISPASDGLHRVYLINPHTLPQALQSSKDGMTNSRKSLDSAVAGLLKMIARFSK